MVNSCSANGCKNRNSKGSTITFHRFPLNNESLLKLWLYQIKPKKAGWEPSKYSVLCSEHFTEDCFVTKGLANSRRTLKNDAVPTIFSMASIVYQEPPRRGFHGRKSKDVAMEEDEELEKDEDEKVPMDVKVDAKNGETKDLNINAEAENGETKGDEVKEAEKEVTSDEENTEGTKNGE